MYETGIGKHAVLEVFDHLVGCPKHPGKIPSTPLPHSLAHSRQRIYRNAFNVTQKTLERYIERSVFPCRRCFVALNRQLKLRPGGLVKKTSSA